MKSAAIICDIDNTLAIRGDRGPYDWTKIGTDRVNHAVALLLTIFKQSHEIILVSGRDSRCRTETLMWLNRNHISFSELFMRPQGNTEKDYLIKREIFTNNIKPYYNVQFVLDDRDQCVKMWREELLLPCFQVNYGDF